MALFGNEVRRRIARDGVTIVDDEHYAKLYYKYRDEICVDRYGMTFIEFKEWIKTQPKNDVVWKKLNKSTGKIEVVEIERYNVATQKWETLWENRGEQPNSSGTLG